MMIKKLYLLAIALISIMRIQSFDAIRTGITSCFFSSSEQKLNNRLARAIVAYEKDQKITDDFRSVMKSIKKGKTVDVNMKGKCGLTALHIAAMKGNIEWLKILLQDSRTIKSPKWNGWYTPLLFTSLLFSQCPFLLFIVYMSTEELEEEVRCYEMSEKRYEDPIKKAQYRITLLKEIIEQKKNASGEFTKVALKSNLEDCVGEDDDIKAE